MPVEAPPKVSSPDDWYDGANKSHVYQRLRLADDFAGSFFEFGTLREVLTLATGGLTTDTTAKLLPANSLILGVSGMVATTITTAANWSIGDPTTATRFTAALTTLTAGFTFRGLNHANAAAAGAALFQSADASVRVTCNANPGAGAIEIVSFFLRFLPPVV
jgi:hypothetical protein